MKGAIELKEIIDVLEFHLRSDPDCLILQEEREISPLEIDFIYNPAPRAPETSSPEKPAEVRPRARLEENAACTLCMDRIFPIKRFRRAGSLPVLTLHYAGPVSGSKTPPDRSDKFVLGSPEADDIFSRMFQSAGIPMDEVRFQQYPGCYFDAARSAPEQWNERCRHCLGHVLKTLREENIRLLLLTGAAAVFLLSEEKARELAVSGEILELPFDDFTVPTMVIRGPQALLALEKRRLSLKADLTPEKRKAYEKTLAEEKKIKGDILRSLKRAKELYLS